MKTLFVPLCLLMMLGLLIGLLWHRHAHGTLLMEVNALYVVLGGLALGLCGIPFLNWLTTSVTVSTKRVIVNRPLRRIRRELRIDQIADVSVSRGILDMLAGSGSVLLAPVSAARRPDGDDFVLPDLPEPEQVAELVGELAARTAPAAQLNTI